MSKTILSEDAWLKKTDKELREIIKTGVRQVNRRKATTKLVTEKEFIGRLSKMQGMTKSSNISASTRGLTHRELVYRARQFDQYLSTDKASAQSFRDLNDISEKSRNTFNERYGLNLTKKEYRQMVELMGAFKDRTQSMDSAQIQTFFEYASNELTSDELANIFGQASKQTFSSETARKDFIFNAIDEMRG